jgi:hypothetical protein
VLKNINTITAVWFESVKKISIPIPQGGLKVLKTDPIPIPCWFESVKKRFNTDTRLV